MDIEKKVNIISSCGSPKKPVKSEDERCGIRDFQSQHSVKTEAKIAKPGSLSWLFYGTPGHAQREMGI